MVILDLTRRGRIDGSTGWGSANLDMGQDIQSTGRELGDTMIHMHEVSSLQSYSLAMHGDYSLILHQSL